MKAKSLLYLISAGVVLVFSCKDLQPVYESDYIGAASREFVVEAVNGKLSFEFYSNRPGHIRMLTGDSWARCDASSFNGNGILSVEYDDNFSFPRSAAIEFALDDFEWRDTVLVKQKGLVEEVFVPASTGVIVYNGKGDTEISVEMNIDPSRVITAVRYGTADTDWVTGVEASDGKIIIHTEDNAGETTRNAVLTAGFVNGWAETVMFDINLTQATSGNLLGKALSYSELAQIASDEGTNLDGNYVLEGYIVSDASTANLSDNPRLTSISIDYSSTMKTAYLESIDGSAGIMLRTASEADNVFVPNSRIQLLLNGAVAYSFHDPERTVLEGVTASMMAVSNLVSETEIPVKKRHIGDLTDADIYTLVTLTDVEIPVRKGGLTPVHDGYTNSCGSHRISKFPVLLRCKDGESIYMLTNTTCPYRRDGTRPGDGSGTVKGIIVHELYRPFREGDSEYEELCGNFSRYQIRHQHQEDIALARDFNDGFSGIIAEWRYMSNGAESSGWMPATKGAGLLNHTAEKLNSLFQTNMYNFQEFSYLGPCGTGQSFFGDHKGNENGLGIYLDDGTDYSAGDAAINKDGKGGGTSKRGYAWAQDYWWDDQSGTPYAWLVRFSTKGVETDCLSLQVALLNMSQSGYTPLNWKIEYSTDNSSWTLLDYFTVPDLVLWNLTLDSQCGGAKQMDFPLPLSLLDQENVYVRMCPSDNVASDTREYANATIKYADGRRNVMNYLAIRYNK